MDNPNQPSNIEEDIPKKIFEKFLDELKDTQTAGDLIDGLKTALMNDAGFTENSIKAALFSEDQNI